MKKLFCIILLNLLLLSACTGEKNAVVLDSDGNVNVVDRGNLPVLVSPNDTGEIETNQTAQWPSSEYRPLAKASTGSFCDGFLYYKDNSEPYIRYINFKTGQSDLCCFDPLCDHGKVSKGGINMASVCTALTTENQVFARQENEHTILYTVRRVFKNEAMSAQIYRFDVNNNKMQLWAELPEGGYLNEMWFYGNELLVSLSRVGEAGEAGIFCVGDDGVRCVIPATETMPTLIGSDQRGLIWRNLNNLYLTSTDFSATVLLTDNFKGQSRFYYDGYIYYRESNAEEAYDLPYMPYDGKYDENWSDSNTGTYTFFPMNWYRLSTEKDAVPELVYQGATESSPDTFFIDTENGILYLQPLDPVYMGYYTYIDPYLTPGAAQQMGFTGEPILYHKWLKAGGRVIAVDLGTLETHEVYNGLDGDITAMYGLTDGKLAVQYTVKDIEKIKETLYDTAAQESVYSFLDLIK